MSDELSALITELERRCQGASFRVEGQYIRILEYGRPFVVDLAALGQTAEEWVAEELARHPAVTPLEPDGRYRVLCPQCGTVTIGYGNYCDQMRQVSSFWYCPRCGDRADFDEENYHEFEDREGD